MNKTNIMLIGGFMGAGKTASILSIAKYMLREGKKTGIIINEQGSLSIDAEFLKRQGLQVLKITGGPLCSSFSNFEEKILTFKEKGDFDMILVEPVGNCTDLIATIIKPIKESNSGKWKDYRILPLSVMADAMYFMNSIHKDADFIIQKQIEEADVIVLNKEDRLNKSDKLKIKEYMEEKYPDKKLFFTSVNQNIGIQEWIYDIFQMGLDRDLYANNSLNICYDHYNEANKDIGWLNMSCEFAAEQRISVITFITSLADHIKSALKDKSNEVIHMKIYFYNNNASCILSCTSVSDENNIYQNLRSSVNYGNLLINIRAFMEPEQLSNITEDILNASFNDMNATHTNLKIESFVPFHSETVYRYL